MEYKLNPHPIFEDKVIKDNLVSKTNKHILKNNKIYFYAYKKNLPYYDHIETSSFYSSLIFSYGANEKKEIYESYHLVFPTFRRKINDTRGSFACKIKNPINILINNKKEKELLTNVILDGFINIESKTKSLIINKKIFCASFPGVLTLYKLTNATNKSININININIENNKINCDENDYFEKPYHIDISLYKNKETNNIIKRIKPHESIMFYLSFACAYDDTPIKNKSKLISKSIYKRYIYLFNINSTYKVTTNNKVLDAMCMFTKIRASESIFLTKNGLMHSPGGGNYYAATWNNDQCEYSAPFFAYIDYKTAKKAMLNCFSQYEDYMYSDTPLVSSIIAEATSYWNGAKDRGDASMYVYGLSSLLLTLGNKNLAKKFVDPIKWCINYTLNRKNKFNVIESDTDELENRFESGKCNLATNAIFYNALIKANYLFNELNIKNDYDIIANKLKDDINNYFYEGNDCIYCKEETQKRSHVVYPLIMGLYDHSDDIINYLMNNNLYTDNGFKTIDNCNTYWDRITLMAIRGIFNANNPNLAYDILEKYSNVRLLNEHVPYAIEAYPEGNQAHLAAENALYCRIYLEGILGFEPISFNLFKLKLSMPDKLNKLIIENITYKNKIFTIEVNKKSSAYLLQIRELNYKTLINNFDEITIKV